MANIKLCDLCSASSEEATVDSYVVERNGTPDFSMISKDLCTECFRKLERFLNGN